MADPVIPDHFRAQVRLQNDTGIPEDVFVNNWAFRNDFVGGDADGAADTIATVLTAAYTILATVLAPTAINAFEPEIRVYDLGQAPPREPHIRPMPLPTQAGNAFPAEVACCLSFYADRNLPRRRGRLYIGPLKASTGSAAEGDIRPTAALQDVLMDAAENVLASSEEATWVLVSQADQAAFPVTAGWVDNAFDTQRRRGLAATSRIAWPRPAG